METHEETEVHEQVEEPGYVWVTFGWDMGPYGVKVFGAELDALRDVATEARGGIARDSIRLPLGASLDAAVQARQDEQRNR